ncbi:PAAR domain-containing protein [Leptolyngbya sp. FACHB-671]|uniref:PAAR domain-containing protein n=1 Tax=Leptolyngbya sp. FACHB-671 TaxID=2692812 RepID=UPI00168247A7|nr:PAAR domain-containing protein [Leptolyngbya sp. FACHB-671]MBD1867175.1 PAAR domain-containing protein [Cyanobacteria bacterium FACHB-471]MBD2066471.1 PAAR domain-containing protein [Leptolyngbya sp. FACHB-671]
MNQFAARLGDAVAHPLPPVLTGGPCSPSVFIGNQPAWLGVPKAALAALMNTVKDAQEEIYKAELATQAVKGTLAEPDAKFNEGRTKIEQTARVTNAIAALATSGVSTHACASLLPTPAPGVVVTGSNTVLINGLPACRAGDTIFEGLHAPNAITQGYPTVVIGG